MEAASQFMLANTGLHIDDADTTSIMHLPRERERLAQVPRRDPMMLRIRSTGEGQPVDAAEVGLSDVRGN